MASRSSNRIRWKWVYTTGNSCPISTLKYTKTKNKKNICCSFPTSNREKHSNEIKRVVKIVSSNWLCSIRCQTLPVQIKPQNPIQQTKKVFCFENFTLSMHIEKLLIIFFKAQKVRYREIFFALISIFFLDFEHTFQLNFFSSDFFPPIQKQKFALHFFLWKVFYFVVFSSFFFGEKNFYFSPCTDELWCKFRMKLKMHKIFNEMKIIEMKF